MRAGNSPTSRSYNAIAMPHLIQTARRAVFLSVGRASFSIHRQCSLENESNFGTIRLIASHTIAARVDEESDFGYITKT